MTGSEPGEAPGPNLTPREQEVLEALADRLTNAEMAVRLFVSERTVESHVSSLLRKWGAANRRELGAISQERRAATRPGPLLPGPLALLSDPDHYVGRTRERSRLDAGWARVTAGQSMCMVLTAEAGMGKSRLAAELASSVHAAGAQVLFGSCTEEGRYPYEPFAHLIRTDLFTLGAAEMDRRVHRQRETLARLIPELASPTPGRTVEPLNEGAGRGDVLAGLLGYLARVAATPTLMVIEDVHWATTTTLDAIRYVARAAGPEPLMLLLTARDVAPDLDHDLEVFLADLARLPDVEQISLPGLSFAEVAELVSELGSDEETAHIVAQAGGNPLLVHEVVNRFDASVAASLPGLLLRRYGLLTEGDLEVLDAAAVIGATFDAQTVATTVRRSINDVLGCLDQAAQAGLVLGEVRRPLHWRFVHAPSGPPVTTRFQRTDDWHFTTRWRGRCPAEPRIPECCRRWPATRASLRQRVTRVEPSTWASRRRHSLNGPSATRRPPTITGMPWKLRRSCGRRTPL